MKKQKVPDLARILELSGYYMVAKVLLTANKLDLFSELAKGPLDSAELRKRLKLHPRGATDFFDALVSLGLLNRRAGLYSNTEQTEMFLDRAKPSYIGGLLNFDDDELYHAWGKLISALRTGKPSLSGKDRKDLYDVIHNDPAQLRTFLRAMTGVSTGPARAIAAKFPWSDFESFVDIGTAQGGLPVQVALAHPRLRGIGFDLPIVRPFFEEYVQSFGLSHRLSFVAGDFFKDPLPEAEVMIMGHILHNWDLGKKRLLIKKAHAALPEQGALIVYESILDDQRRKNTGGLLASLNMLVVTQGGFEYTQRECSRWMREAGFRRTYATHLIGPKSMIVGIK